MAFAEKLIFSAKSAIADDFVNIITVGFGHIRILKWFTNRLSILKKITIWCGFWAQGVIGPYFFCQDDDGNRITVNGKLYRKMLI